MSFLRTINQRLKSCFFVEQTILNHGQRIADKIGEAFAPLQAAGVPMPDFWVVQQFFLELLRYYRDRIEEAEGAHVDELADDKEPRLRRNRAAAALRNRLNVVKAFFAGAYQLEDIEQLAFPKRVGRGSEELLRQVDHLVLRLGDEAIELPKPQLGELTLSPAETATLLAPMADDLRTALADVGREAKEAKVTRIDRDRAVAEYDAVFLWSARALEALFHLAGETELAEQVRPSTRRPGRTLKEPAAEKPEVQPEQGGEQAEDPASTAG